MEVKKLKTTIASYNSRIQHMEDYISDIEAKYWPLSIMMWQKKRKINEWKSI